MSEEERQIRAALDAAEEFSTDPAVLAPGASKKILNPILDDDERRTCHGPDSRRAVTTDHLDDRDAIVRLRLVTNRVDEPGSLGDSRLEAEGLKQLEVGRFWLDLIPMQADTRVLACRRRAPVGAGTALATGRTTMNTWELRIDAVPR